MTRSRTAGITMVLVVAGGALALSQTAVVPAVARVSALPEGCENGCSLQMLNAEYGWLKGRTQMWHTADGGKDWVPYSTPARVDDGDYAQMHAGENGFGWWFIIGRGPLYVTRSGGQAWTPLSLPSFDGVVSSVWSLPQNATAWLGGGVYEKNSTPDAPNYALRRDQYGGWSILKPIVFFTPDLGRSWSRQPMPDCSYNVIDLRFWTVHRGYAVGDGCFYYTADGGVSWRVGHILSDKYPSEDSRRGAITFLGESTGWMSFSDHSLFRTTNGGKNWQLISRVHYFGKAAGSGHLQFVTKLHGFGISDQSRLFETKDGGITWRQVRTPFLVRSLSVSIPGLVWVLSDTDMYRL